MSGTQRRSVRSATSSQPSGMRSRASPRSQPIGARDMTRVVVIGAGLSGLSAACHLVGGGADVTLVEASSAPGGRAGSLSLGDYRFDTGPTVITMPDLVESCFTVLGRDMGDYLPMRPVDPMYRACFADGSELRVRHGRDAMADEIRSVIGPKDAAAFDGFCDWLGQLYRLEMPRFIDRNYSSPLDLIWPLGPAISLAR